MILVRCGALVVAALAAFACFSIRPPAATGEGGVSGPALGEFTVTSPGGARGTVTPTACLAGDRELFFEAGRAEDQHVIERFAPPPRRLDEYLHLRLDGALADVIGKPLRAHGAVESVFIALGGGGYDAVLFDHLTAAACRALRIISSVVCTEGSTAFSRRVTSAGL